MSKYDYLIIGNSVGAIGAVEAIRSAGNDGSIAVVSDEPYHVYSRPRISELLTKHADAVAITYRPMDFYQVNGVTPILGDLATSVDSQKKTVRLADKKTLEYGSLLLATGSRAAKPPIPGIDLQGIHYFTTFAEAERLAGDIGGVSDAVVIGAGLIGLQAAEALAKIGVRVTVVEMLDRPLALAVDEHASALIRSRFEQNGVQFRLSSRVSEIMGDSLGRVSGVTLSDGSGLDCGILVVAAGVTPRTELAESADINTKRGIVIDNLMRTSADDIYAAGDVAEGGDLLLGGHRVLPIWPNAYLQGRTAGLTMTGRKAPYAGGVAMNAAHFFDYAVVSAGVTDQSQDVTNLIEVNERTGYYRRIVVKDDMPIGMVMTGDAVDRAGLVLSLIRNKVNAGSFMDKLASPGFSIAHLPEELRELKKSGGEKI